MKMIRSCMLFLAMLAASKSIAQQLPPSGTPSVAATSGAKQVTKSEKGSSSSHKLSFTAGIGIANYVGDLINGATAFGQSSYSINAGVSYSIIPHISARFDIGFHNVQGYDTKSGGAHPERNLSFRSIYSR
jgi:hypothetical protein